MPPRRAVKGHPTRRNIEEDELPNAPEVQPQGEVNHAEFRETIGMLSQVATQVGQRRNRQEVADTSRILEFLGMNPPSFTSSSVTEDLENFVEVLQKNFEILPIVDAERVELAAYQLKGIARVWFDQWKKNRADDTPIMSWVVFESALMGYFFPRICHEGSTGCFKCGQNGHFMRECPKNMQGNGNRGNRAPLSSVSPLDKVAPRGATLGTGGETNCLYAINCRQKQENFPDVVTARAYTLDMASTRESFMVPNRSIGLADYLVED
ncbi:uncharacterized protein LOC125851761 [Solanum stenotomum]|uniref:uncharacterized protein LOC125851761 n=1 Tax=Solanum stenotomum TaxID=172797 RepID=UPI0020D10E8F|nr:uncharacterized protein LOC125851761 [Solanum stenotomum]